MKRHVRTFSRVFPKGHPREGQPTYFVEKFWQSLYNDYDLLPMGYMSQQGLESELVYFEGNHDFDPKHHTIRAGHHIKAGDVVSFRVWGDNVNPKSGRKGPRHSKQIIIAPDVEIKKVWDFGVVKMPDKLRFSMPNIDTIAKNDGLDLVDFMAWFNKPFDGQIICWSDKIEY